MDRRNIFDPEPDFDPSDPRSIARLAADMQKIQKGAGHPYDLAAYGIAKLAADFEVQPQYLITAIWVFLEAVPSPTPMMSTLMRQHLLHACGRATEIEVKGGASEMWSDLERIILRDKTNAAVKRSANTMVFTRKLREILERERDGEDISDFKGMDG